MALASGFLLGLVVTVRAARHSERHSEQHVQAANPIRKVVNLLQDMDKTIREEGEKEEEMYKKYMCYCKTNNNSLSASIDAATARVPDLTTDIEQAQTDKAGLDEEVKKAQADRAAAKQVLADETAAREKDAAAFAKVKAEMETNIAAINKSVAALSQGAYGTFLQTSTAATLRKLLSSATRISEEDISDLQSFLSDDQSSGYAPSSGEVIGILKQLGDEFTTDLKEQTAAEDTAIQSYEDLKAAKAREVAALTETIERKMAQSAELGVKIVMMQQDLTETQAALIEDQKFIKDLKENCATKKDEWEKIVADRDDELTAIAETIKLLNDDDALDVFKKTLPSATASFMQITGERLAKARALEIVHKASKGSADTNRQPGGRRLDFLALLLQGKTVSFEKVLEMIDEMIANLKTEQVDDDNHVEYCTATFDIHEDKQKSHKRSLAGTETEITEATEGLKLVTERIEALERDIKDIDKLMAESTDQRKEEHELFVRTTQDDQTAKQLLGKAKNRLHEFYTPQLHVTTAAPQLSRQDEIANAFTFLETTSVARPEAPDAPGPYSKKMEENNGVIAMIDLLIQDLDKELTQMEADETSAQKAYEELSSDLAGKRVANARDLTDSNDSKAKLEESLVALQATKSAISKELMALEQAISELHGECDWLLKYQEQRKAARTSEIESLGEAKAVLSGANYALLQTYGKHQLGNLRTHEVMRAM